LIPSYNPASRNTYLLMMSFMLGTVKSNALTAVGLESLQAKYADDVTGSELLRSDWNENRDWLSKRTGQVKL